MTKKAQVLLILGSQWGDEGKGKVVDCLSAYFDIAVRFQGGPNAGHTVVFDGKKIVLHTIPTGILRENCSAVISNGVFVDPDVLKKELETLKTCGIDYKGRLFISYLSHIILPFHKILDEIIDKKGEIGTTKMGVGPAVDFKVLRKGIRIKDIFSSDLKIKIKERLEYVKSAIGKDSDINLDEEQIYDKLARFGDFVKDYLVDTQLLLKKAISDGKKILLEGAQGILLDLDFGTYPFVTSTNTTPGGAICGTGLSPRDIDVILGVTKAYATRVGGGPFPSEIKDQSISSKLRELGGEYGATTGRPRRVGWIDLPLLKYSKNIGAIDFIALTKVDVLEKFGKSFYVQKYTIDGKELMEFDSSCDLYKVNPILKEIQPIKIKDLIQEELQTEVVILSYGSDRSDVKIDEKFLSLFL